MNPFGEDEAALRAVLDATPEPERLHELLAALRLPPYVIDAALRRSGAPPEWRLRAGRWLVRHGTGDGPVCVGLALLVGVATVDDAPVVGECGRAEPAGPFAARVLAGIPGATGELLRLAAHCAGHTRVTAIGLLLRPPAPGDTARRRRRDAALVPPPPEVRAWLARHAVGDERLPPSTARDVAEAVDLVALLDGDDPGVVEQAGRLLLAMADTGDRTELGRYAGARTVYRAIAGRVRDPAVLAGLAEEVRTGFAACLDWAPGERAEILARLSGGTLPADGFRIVVVVPPPEAAVASRPGSSPTACPSWPPRSTRACRSNCSTGACVPVRCRWRCASPSRCVARGAAVPCTSPSSATAARSCGATGAAMWVRPRRRCGSTPHSTTPKSPAPRPTTAGSGRPGPSPGC
ncbi:hypothetical protein [Dactylosporangium cerinum]